MPVMLQPRSVHTVSQNRHQLTQDQLHVERKDIVFYNVRQDRMRIEVTVCNLGLRRSAPAPLRLQAAPLGAFLTWTDLSELWVPSLRRAKGTRWPPKCPLPRPNSWETPPSCHRTVC